MLEQRDLVCLVVASCCVRHRYFAGIANIGEMSFHAGLNAALARFDACAKLFHVSRTCLGVHSLEHHRLAALGQVLDVQLEAVLDLASPRLHACAKRLGITSGKRPLVLPRQEHGSNNMAMQEKES